MRKYEICHEGKTYKRIDKKTARRAYNNGCSLVFCPVNLRPFSMWHPEYITRRTAEPSDRTFERLCSELEWYGCTGSEAGRYMAFYLPIKTVDRFTGEAPTADTLGTVDIYDPDAIQWETWTCKGVEK